MSSLDNEEYYPRIDGKFFRVGREKFFPKGLVYGPFASGTEGECFKGVEETREDLQQVRRAGANLLRVYHTPPRWFMDMAEELGVMLLIDVPWHKDVCFLDSPERRAAAIDAVKKAAEACLGVESVFALSVVNEIPPDIVRWSGPGKVAEFIDELISAVKKIDARRLCTFGNFPPTEYLSPSQVDFHCFNVYLHEREDYRRYISKLQIIAGNKPLVLGELGMDSLREGEIEQAHFLEWQIEDAFCKGAAGVVVFSFTDEWYKGGREVDDWKFGITTRSRDRKPAFFRVRTQFEKAPYFPLAHAPAVSVIIACYNGAATLRPCLESLIQLRYPKYEVILVDDGSTDKTVEIAGEFPEFKLIRHSENLGLSVARDSGIAVASGEIVAFMDADCRADEDWLYYLARSFEDDEFHAMGGPNLPPADDSVMAAVVNASPGGPAHVMLDDRYAEHVPGCNMAFRKSVLSAIGGFDPVFTKAGDDVDICWRLRKIGADIGFSPAALVWHHRRSGVVGYLTQQYGYGQAEALLVKKHPEKFNFMGGGLWRGRIYSHARPVFPACSRHIYHGRFGAGMFQSIYSANWMPSVSVFTTLEYHFLLTLPLALISLVFNFIAPMAIVSFGASIGACVVSAYNADIPKDKRRFWSKSIVGLMWLLQPLVRGVARYRRRLASPRTPLAEHENLVSLSLKKERVRFDQIRYWDEAGIGRLAFLAEIISGLEQENWEFRNDQGWNRYDVEIIGSRWCRLRLLTVAEVYEGGRMMIKCRLKPFMSFASKIVLTGVMVTALLLLQFGTYPVVWGGVTGAVLVFLLWIFHKSKRDLGRVVSVFLDRVAEKLELKKV
ncbi:MAG: glycosyltransferase [Verrucomicrobia bacterium]|nr:glycosyltransferase [Verrucomicrobiota bacterium]